MNRWSGITYSLTIALASLNACAVDTGLGDEELEEYLGASEDEIIGGFTPFPGKNPWLARITLNGAHWCGGSLIHPQWLLTAGHCVDGVTMSNLHVIMGDHFTNANDGTEQTRTVAQMIRHPNFGYSSNAPFNDVALLQVSSAFTIGAGAQTVALGTSAPEVVGTVAGWGWTSAPGGSSSTVIQQANARIWANTVCNDAPLARNLFGGEICAGTGTLGVCHGDSGGPLTHTEAGRQTQLGVVSWGRGGQCDTHQVYARVATYRNWIVNTVGVPLRGDVRMTWGGNLSAGSVQLRCWNSGEIQSAPTDVRGVEISLDCDNSWVLATCNLTNANRSIDGFDKTVNGVQTGLSYGNSSASAWHFVQPGSVVEFDCSVTD